MDKENLEEMKEFKDSSSSNEDHEQPSEEDYDQEENNDELRNIVVPRAKRESKILVYFNG